MWGEEKDNDEDEEEKESCSGGGLGLLFLSQVGKDEERRGNMGKHKQGRPASRKGGKSR